MPGTRFLLLSVFVCASAKQGKKTPELIVWQKKARGRTISGLKYSFATATMTKIKKREKKKGKKGKETINAVTVTQRFWRKVDHDSIHS